jgi:Flp pilus assembly protein TadB
MRDVLAGNEVEAGVCALLLIVSVVLLFVPVADGASELRVLFFLLTSILVVDLVRSFREDKRVRDVQEALDPSPPPSHAFEREDAEAM